MNTWASGQLGSLAEIRGGRSVDARALEQLIETRARELGALGCGPGDYALILHGGGIDFLVDLLAIWQCGAAAACLNPASTRHEQDTVRAQLAPRLVIDGERGVTVTGAARQIARGPRADDDALLLFTSGTSGVPKGVVHTFRSLESRIALNSLHIPREALAASLCLLPMHFGHALIGNVLTPLLTGARVVLWPSPTIPELGQLAHIIEAQEIRFFSSVPALWRILRRVAAPRPAAGRLRRVHIGSAPLSAALWAWAVGWAGTDEVLNMYGITETANWVAGARWSQGAHADNRVGTLWGGTAAVLTADGQVSSRGAGEILIRTPSVMRGYFARDDLTEAAFHAGWFRTGDLGCIDRHGAITLTGRAKSEINRGGVKIAPEEIELLLDHHSDVAQACCFGFDDEVMGERVGVAVVPAHADFDLDAVRSWARTQLVHEKIPDRWFIVDAIPVSDRGKVRREDVARLCFSDVEQ